MHKEIRFTGFGGQGIIKAGFITGKAACIYDDKHSTLTQSYGPESRGGACSAQLVISSQPVTYPDIIEPDIFISMSQEAYTKYKDNLKSGGVMLIDEDLVKTGKVRTDVKFAKIPATSLAENIGQKVVANIVMLGFMTAITKVVSKKAMTNAIKTSVPKGTETINLKAFEKGYEYGTKIL